MLIEFSVANFRSFKDRQTLSMVAANLVSKDKALDVENTIPVDSTLTLLTSTAIYGANASGKSNVVRAISFMRSFVLNSSRETQIQDPIRVEVFRLSTETEDQPSSFEMIFILDGKKYRYGFEVTTQEVVAEWLYWVPTSRESPLFRRRLKVIEISGQFSEGKGLDKRIRSNALFLSVAAQFDGDISKKIVSWFGRLIINIGVNDARDSRRSHEEFHHTEDKEGLLQFVRDLDLGISDIYSEQNTIPPPPAWEADEANRLLLERFLARQVTVTRIKTIHQKYDGEGNGVKPEIFDLTTHESAGTQRLFILAGFIINALKLGHIIFVDELDARLHPLITSAIINLFNNKKSNPKDAQLVFTTHDTNLLSNRLFRRDQLWFTEKDRFGATHLYSLAEFKVRNDASYEKDYIQGRYGAIPFINSDLQVVAGGNDDRA